jgi:hypothetical protein
MVASFDTSEFCDEEATAVIRGSSNRSAHFSLLDPLLDPRVGYSLSSHFEHHTPGLWDSAIVWADLHCLVREVVDIGGPAPGVALRVRLTNGGLFEVHRAMFA